jgi:hypothetical protein
MMWSIGRDAIASGSSERPDLKYPMVDFGLELLARCRRASTRSSYLVTAKLRSICDRSLLWFGGGFLILMCALLIGPRVPDDQQVLHCVVNVHLPGPFGIGLNCDSPEFMRLASEPSALLEPLNTRQSRPGLIAAAATLTWALSPLTALTYRLHIQASRADIDPQRIANAVARDLPAYLAYIIINVLLVLTAFCLFRLICAPWVDNTEAAMVVLASIGFLLVANDVVKAFVWSPHTQMFNILVPVFALYASMRANAGALIQRRFAISIGIFAGLGGTAYPLLVIALPCVAICGLGFAWRQGSRKIWSVSVVNILVLAFLVFLPEALWAAFVGFKIGHFYQHEVSAHGQVVWMLDAWHDGLFALASIWLSKFALLFWMAAPQAIPLIAVLVATFGISKWWRKRDVRRSLVPLAATGVFVSAVTAAFYASVGLIVSRIAFSIIPPLIVVAAGSALAVTEGDYARRRILAFFCAAFALVAAVYTVAKNGPYS